MGRNNADFEGVTMHHEGDFTGGVSVIANHPKDGEVGRLWLSGSWDHLNGGRMVRDLEVHPEHRRKGIATAMWSYAKAQGFNPQHDVGGQTAMGKKWAKSVGE